MKNSEINEKLNQLREAYKTATPELKVQITKEAGELKAKLKRCYQCHEELSDENPSYFCSKTCKDEYWKEPEMKTTRSLTYMQERIKSWTTVTELAKTTL